MKRNLFFFLAISFACNNAVNQQKLIEVSTSDSTKQQKLAAKGNSFYMSDRFLEAVKIYDTLISIDSTKAGYYFKRGYCKSMIFDSPDEAIADYLKSIEKNYSEKSISYLNIGALYNLHGRYDSALYFYDECLKINPNQQKAKQQRSEVLQIIKSEK